MASDSLTDSKTFTSMCVISLQVIALIVVISTLGIGVSHQEEIALKHPNTSPQYPPNYRHRAFVDSPRDGLALSSSPAISSHVHSRGNNEPRQDDSTSGGELSLASRSLEYSNTPTVHKDDDDHSKRRTSKIDQIFTDPKPMERSGAADNEPTSPRVKNRAPPPSSMDDLLGGLLQLMGGNLKFPPDQQQQQQAHHPLPPQLSQADHLASMMKHFPMNPQQQQQQHRRPPPPPLLQNLPPGLIPPMAAVNKPNNFAKLLPNLAKLSNNGQHPLSGQVGSNSMYQIPFIPLLGASQRPSIPLKPGASHGMNEPNQVNLNPFLNQLPHITGLSKGELEKLYNTFVANSSPADKNALLSEMIKLDNTNKKLNNPAKVKSSLNLEPSFSSSIAPQMVKSTVWHGFNHSDMIASTPILKETVTNEEPPQIITMQEQPSVFEMIVKHKIGPSGSIKEIDPTSVRLQTSSFIFPSKTSVSLSSSIKSETISLEASREMAKPFNDKNDKHVPSSRFATRSHVHTSPSPQLSSQLDTDVVYGKQASSVASSSLAPSATMVKAHASEMPKSANADTGLGKPMVKPVAIESVKPKVSRPTMHQNDYSSQDFKLSSQEDKSSNQANNKSLNETLKSMLESDNNNSKEGVVSSKKTQAKPFIRRPSFRPRPNVPIVRIDTCIVGDDSTCDATLNEKCLTELGLSSCQCKPGYARQIPRTACLPVISLAISFRVDRMNSNKVQFTRALLNANSEEYQYLEFESMHAMNSLFSSTKTLANELMGVKVNRFYSVGGKTIVNATIHLRNNDTSQATSSSIKKVIQHELVNAISSLNNQLGESQLLVDTHSNAITRIDDLNECTNAEMNDCAKLAHCINEFGGFRCECEPGYEDKHAEDRYKAGRVCSSCSPSFCSNRGECLIAKGEKVCRCKPNFIGSQCDMDVEVLGVAIGGSIAAIIIIVITFICLYMWNQRFKQEQQKIEAMSAASGHTFSYVNKHGQHTLSRMPAIDERYGRSWTNYHSDSQQHLLASNGAIYGMSGEHQMANAQHAYAQPVRVIGGNNATLRGPSGSDYHHSDYVHSLHNNGNRSLKSVKGRSHQGYPHPVSSKSAVDSSYNETEFSTREFIYSPSHNLYGMNQAKSGWYS